MKVQLTIVIINMNGIRQDIIQTRKKYDLLQIIIFSKNKKNPVRLQSRKSLISSQEKVRHVILPECLGENNGYRKRNNKRLFSYKFSL